MRVTKVNAARKPAGTCLGCREPVQVGQGYSWCKPRYGGRRVRHATCLPFRPSETTSNAKIGALLDLQVDQEPQFEWDPEAPMSDDIEIECRSWQEDTAAAIREVAGEFEEAASNLEDGFGHETSQSTELREQGESVEEWADRICDIDPLNHSTYGEWVDEFNAELGDCPL